MSARVLEPELSARLSPARGRPALEFRDALARVRETTGVDLSCARARAGFARGHLIDVLIELPGGHGTDGEHAAAAELVRGVAGDAFVDDFVGELAVQPAPRGGALRVLQPAPQNAPFWPLDELPAALSRAVAGLYEGLPERPLWALGGEQRWSLLELDVEPATEYPAQADVALCSTFLPEMLKCFLSGAPFASRRFSKHGEVFSYLKVKSVLKDPRLALAARRVLEDALDAALVTERCGRVVGGGVGVRYAYVDLALDGVGRALAVLREVAERVGLPDESWLLFCDRELEELWEPLRPASPPPPGQRA